MLITFVLSPLACQNHDLQKVSLGGCEVFFLQLNSRIISVRCALTLSQFVCVCEILYVCVCSGPLAHASLDMQSVSLVLSERSPSIWPRPVSPAAVFRQQFVAGANMCSITVYSLCPSLSSWEDHGEQREALLFLAFHVMPVCSVTLLQPRGSTWDGCCSHPLWLIATSDSVLSKSLPFSIANHLSLFINLHLLAHCYSLLLATPLLFHCIMFVSAVFTSLSLLCVTGFLLLLLLS